LGYLHDSYLRKVGMARLADLSAEYGEIVCSGIISESSYIHLDLPAGNVLGRAISDFLNDQIGPGQQGQPSPAQGTDLPPRRRHTQASEHTTVALSQLRAFKNPRRPVRGLAISTLSGWADPRSLHLDDADSGRHVGTVAMGHLFLEDERDRPEVLSLLAEAGIPVAEPVDNPLLINDDEWPSSTVPNMWTYWFVEGLDFRPRDPSTPRTRMSVAHYNPTTKKLWVEDSRLAAPACIHAARIGVEVAEVGLPRIPWTLESEVSRHDLKDLKRRSRKRREVPLEVALLKSVRPLLPDDLLPAGRVSWVSAPAAVRYEPESTDVFIRHERYVRRRSSLFGTHQVSSTTAPCRLCGQPSLKFTAAICVEPLSYCHECLNNATTGLSLPGREQGEKDRASAALALCLLGQREFDGTPMLEQQLDTMHVDPNSPVTARDIDRLLLLRFAIRRGQYPWTYLLEEAGFNEDGLRSSRGTLIRARDGHRCLSLSEKAVCDFLHQNGIMHEREPHYPPDPELNVHGLRRADWLLEDGTFVEFWGLPNQVDYAAKMKEKRELAARNGISLIELVEADLRRLPAVFAHRAPAVQDGQTTWSWSPVLAPNPPAAASSSGRAYNPTLRQDRLERCVRAVKSQAEGLSRMAIGEKLGVGTESVKGLLRDGKFYADPQSDPERIHLARVALEAKRRGKTRAEFQTEQRLSNQKAVEAWRDAAVAGVVSEDSAKRANSAE
jgi:hypothetical protein